MIVVDNFTRFTWAILLRFKSEAPSQLETLCRRLENEKGLIINCLQSDHGRGFENSQLEQFFDQTRMAQEFFPPITPQQNGVVKRKNRII